MESNSSDLTFVKSQYQETANLEARIALHERFSNQTQNFFQWVFDHISVPKQAHILEIGCGTGLLWHENRNRIPDGWQLILSDLSLAMAEKSKSIGVTANALECDVQALPFPSASFDGVVADHMLYHVPNLSLGLAEIRRVLKRGGKLYAATNGSEHMKEPKDLLTEITQTKATQPSIAFNLENGAERLGEQFSSIRRYDFPDGLIVTQVEPLFAYAMSIRLAGHLRDPEIQKRLRHAIAERIEREGAFRIVKSNGLFEATAQ